MERTLLNKTSLQTVTSSNATPSCWFFFSNDNVIQKKNLEMFTENTIFMTGHHLGKSLSRNGNVTGDVIAHIK